MTNIDEILEDENKILVKTGKPESEEDKKPKIDELNKAKVNGDRIDKKLEKPKEKQKRN